MSRDYIIFSIRNFLLSSLVIFIKFFIVKKLASSFVINFGLTIYKISYSTLLSIVIDTNRRLDCLENVLEVIVSNVEI